ncbi:MAG TPA: DUF2269 family protein [Mycobacteriales bacterium]
MRAVLVIHVVLAIFLIGPLVAAANQVARELRSGSAGTVRLLSRTVTIYGWASLLVGIVGFGLVRDRFSFSDGWLIASIILFVVASVLVLALLVPMLRRASASPGSDTAAGDTAAGETTAGETAALAPRAAALAGVASLCYVAIAVLMTWKPGG